jgi:hypothetical protein
VKRVLIIGLFLCGAVVAACKSGEGERCQVDDDCTAGLSCNKTKNTCESSSGADNGCRNNDDCVPPMTCSIENGKGTCESPPDAGVDSPGD